MNECISKMYNNASKARLECLGAGHASSSKICLLSEVRFWDVCGLYGPDGLRLLVLFQNLHCIRRFQVSCPPRWNVQDCLNCAFNTAPVRAKDLAVCSSLFFFFWKKIYFLFVFERKSISSQNNFGIVIHLVLHQFTRILWKEKDFEDQNIRFWYLIYKEEKIPALMHISLFILTGLYFCKERYGLKTSTNSNAIL